MDKENFDDIALRLRGDDDVAVLKRTIKAGTELLGGPRPLKAANTIPAGHKIALTTIAEGAPVRKYGQVIGFATKEIDPGEHVHTHNLGMRDFERQYQIGVASQPVNYYGPEQMRSFQGFARSGGRVGTRNYVAVISSVNCSASVSQYIAERFRGPDLERDFPHIDGVVAFTHKSGCAIQPGEPYDVFQRVLAGLARHPNIAGYVLMGLGCEVAQVHLLVNQNKLDQVQPGETAPTFLTIQNVGGVRKSVEAGVQAVARLLPAVDALRRSSQPISKLILAENCGGSDGNSGISANPALGVASDELVRYGGTSVLAETPEIYGAEHLLVRRAVSREVGEKLIGLIRWWEDHARQHHATIDNNPSYGNREGGLTTIYEKSLGAVAKGGQSPLAAVYNYSEPVTASGLCFMDTPGFDPVSMTGLVCGGCTIGVFTTGRGSVYGCKPTPCIKVATNSALYNWMPEDMDLNAGTILDGVETVEQVGARIFEKILAVASGEKTKSELAGMGDQEFAPWILGPDLLNFNRMRAAQLIAHGTPGRIHLVDLPEPQPAPDEAIVQVRACGLNRLDLWLEEGALPLKLSLPRTPGGEIAGEIASLGSDVQGGPWDIGDRVAVQSNVFCGRCEFCLAGDESLCLQGQLLGVQRDGGFAEQVAVPARALVRLPENAPFEASAALTLAGSTAMHMLTNRAQVTVGQWVLVIGAASGVGSAAIQIAQRLGAYVIATGSAPAKRDLALSLGAKAAVDSTRDDWPAEVRKLTNKRGVDLVIEHVGGPVLEQSFQCLARGGSIVSCGATGRQVELNLWPFFVKQQKLIGSYGRTRADMVATLEWLAAGKLRPVIDRIVSLEDTPAAFAALRQRSVLGKVLVQPNTGPVAPKGN